MGRMEYAYCRMGCMGKGHMVFDQNFLRVGSFIQTQSEKNYCRLNNSTRKGIIL